MKCLRCQAENPPGTRFCGQCAAPFASVCPSCGASNPPDNKFCGQCAAPLDRSAPTRFAAPESYTPKHLAEKILTSRTALEGERKQLTVLFADLKGSMELLADRDPEEARRILDPILEQMMEAVHYYEGTVNQVMGDGIMALFGAPLAHEDHAVRACYAALRMQESVKRYGESVRRQEGVLPQIRVGLNSGEVVVRSIGSDLHIDYTAVGEPTHLAARVEQAARPGSVLITAATLQLAEGYVLAMSLGPVNVKGLGKPVEGDELPAGDRVAQRVLADRGMGRQAEGPREGDREAPVTGPGAGAVAPSAPGSARGSARRRRMGATGTRGTSAAHARRREASPAQRESRAAARDRVRGSPLDRLRDPGRAGQPRREPAGGSCSTSRHVPTRVPAWVGQQDVLHAAPHGSPGGDECDGASPGAARCRSLARRAQAPVDRKDGREPVLPRGACTNPRGDEGARRRARRISPRRAHPPHPGPGQRSRGSGRAHRPAARRGEASAPGGRGHRPRRTVRAASGGCRAE